MKSESSRRQPVKSVSCFRGSRSLAYLHGLPALRELRLCVRACVSVSVCASAYVSVSPPVCLLAFLGLGLIELPGD